MTDLITIIEKYLTGNPLIDSILIGILFVIFHDMYSLLFSAVFSWFKKS